MAQFFDRNDTQQVTAFFDEEGNQIFETLGILTLALDQSNVFAEHTLEDGTVVSDNKIVTQKRVNVTAILNPDDYVEVYKRLKEADKNSTRFTVQTRVDSYDNMYIESMPYEESSRIANTIPLTIGFVEQQFVGVKVTTLPPSKVKQPQNADTVDIGTKLPQQDQTTLQRLSSLVGF